MQKARTASPVATSALAKPISRSMGRTAPFRAAVPVRTLECRLRLAASLGQARSRCGDAERARQRLAAKLACAGGLLLALIFPFQLVQLLPQRLAICGAQPFRLDELGQERRQRPAAQFVG